MVYYYAKKKENDRVCEGSYEIKVRAHTGPIKDYVFVYWYDIDAKTGNEAIDKLKKRILTLAEQRDRKQLEAMSFHDHIIDMLFRDGNDFVKYWEFIVRTYPDYYDYLEKKD